MSARKLVEEVELGAPDPGDAVDALTIQVSGDGAQKFRSFIETLVKICNSGCSRRLVIKDPVDDRKRECHWDFDGDGNTRIQIVED